MPLLTLRIKIQGIYFRISGYIQLYTTLSPKNKDIGYLFLDVRLYIVKELEISQEYIDLEEVSNKEAVQTLPNPILVKYKIDIGDKQPPFRPLYNLLENELAILRQYIVDNLQKGQIQPSISLVGALIIFIPKKDRTLYLYINYQALNKITIKNYYPLPLIGELINRLLGVKIFIKLDLKDIYY